jgi:hypothetical protein
MREPMPKTISRDELKQIGGSRQSFDEQKVILSIDLHRRLHGPK